MSRLTAILVVALLAAGAGGRVLFHVPEDQVLQNRLEWNGLDAAARDDLRARWARARSSEGADRDRVERRMATLSRLLVDQRRRSSSGSLDAQALEGELVALPARVDAHVDPAGTQPGTVVEKVQRRTERWLGQFLANLERAGRLTAAEHGRLRGQPFTARVAEGLELQKREEIDFLSEGIQPERARDLVEAEPLAVVAHARDSRRRQGFIGRASRVLELSLDDRSRLATVPDEQLVGLLRELMVPKVRRHLALRGVPAEQVEAILGLPYRELERTLDSLERGERPAR